MPVVVGRRAEADRVVRRLGLQVLGDDLPRLEGIFMDDVAAVDAREVAAAAGAVVVGHHVELLGRVHGLAVEGEAADAIIKQVFIRYNTPRPSSAPVERLFSFATMINQPRSHKLSDQLFEKRVVLKANIL